MRLHSGWAVAALAAFTVFTTACNDFLDVENPNNLEAEAIDEERDRTILSQSAYQSLVANYGTTVVYQAWFTNEARVGDTFPTRNEFGRRDIPLDGENAGRWTDLYNPISYALNTIRSIEPAGNNVDLARAYFTAGYGLLLVGETYCMGTVPLERLEAGMPLTSAQTIDSALVKLQKAFDIARALTGTEATNLRDASLVALARGHLQNGRKTQASQFAAQVPAAFTYNFLHLDDPSNRGRLGNTVWSFSESRISLVVGPEFRAMADAGDTRIAYTDMRRPAQDGVLNFFRQAKITGWGSPDRAASGLEAQYIKVEADGNAADMLAFINARRAVGRQTVLAATTDMNVLMRELMEQKARDFWLEAKRVGDFRRNPQHVPYIIPTGNNYYKPEVGSVGSQTCFPVPGNEVRNNPNWPKT
ncbi:MAG: hypothetical protein ACRENP_10500 [Longimicrobiales bacterium]